MERITVGIPAYRERTIGATLEAVLAQNLPDLALDIAVCIRDGDGGTKDIVAGLARLHPEIRYYVTEYPGKPWALQWVADSSDADVIAICDADTVPRRGAVQTLYDALKDPRLKLAGGHLIMDTRGSRGIMKQFNRILAHNPDKATLNGRFFADTREARTTVGPYPLNAITEDQWKSLSTQATFGPKSFQIIPAAVATYIPPLTVGDWWKYRVRTAAGHRQLRREYPDLDFKPSGILYKRGKFIGDLPLYQKLMLPLMGTTALLADAFGADEFEFGHMSGSKGIDPIERTKRSGT